jgi:hypothetical protein
MFVEQYEEAVKGNLEKESYEDLSSDEATNGDGVARGRSSSKGVHCRNLSEVLQ